MPFTRYQQQMPTSSSTHDRNSASHDHNRWIESVKKFLRIVTMRLTMRILFNCDRCGDLCSRTVQLGAAFPGRFSGRFSVRENLHEILHEVLDEALHEALHQILHQNLHQILSPLECTTHTRHHVTQSTAYQLQLPDKARHNLTAE